MQGRMLQSGLFLRMITLLLAATVRVGADPTRKPSPEPTLSPSRMPTIAPTPVFNNAPSSSIQSPYTLTFTGSGQNFTVPAGVTSLVVTLYGGSGAGADSEYGRGATISSIIPVTPGEVLLVTVGSGGKGDQGGYNGGGRGGAYSYVGGGGGATDIRRFPYNLDDRFLIAGGGGGAGFGSLGGNGGVEATRYFFPLSHLLRCFKS